MSFSYTKILVSLVALFGVQSATAETFTTEGVVLAGEGQACPDLAPPDIAFVMTCSQEKRDELALLTVNLSVANLLFEREGQIRLRVIERLMLDTPIIEHDSAEYIQLAYERSLLLKDYEAWLCRQFQIVKIALWDTKCASRLLNFDNGEQALAGTE